MELLKELKREKIKIRVDDKDNPRDFNFFDMRDFRDEEICADDFESAVIKFLNERESRALYDIRMDISHGGRPDPEPRESLNRY